MNGTLTALRRNRLHIRPTADELEAVRLNAVGQLQSQYSRLTMILGASCILGLVVIRTLHGTGDTALPGEALTITVGIAVLLALGLLWGYRRGLAATTSLDALRARWQLEHGPIPAPKRVDDILAVPAELTCDPQALTLSWTLSPKLAQLVETRDASRACDPEMPEEGLLELGMTDAGLWRFDEAPRFHYELTQSVEATPRGVLRLAPKDGPALVLDLDKRFFKRDEALAALPALERRGILLWDKDLSALLTDLKLLCEAVGDPLPEEVVSVPRGGIQPLGVSNELFESFGDLFGEMLGVTKGGGGADITVPLRLSKEEARYGVKKAVSLSRRRRCGTCDGSGSKDGAATKVCGQCEGGGKESIQEGFFSMTRMCSLCGGSGVEIEHPCGVCEGQGTLTEHKTLTVTVPSKVVDGTKLRLAEQGHQSREGALGHLFVAVEVKG